MRDMDDQWPSLHSLSRFILPTCGPASDGNEMKMDGGIYISWNIDCQTREEWDDQSLSTLSTKLILWNPHSFNTFNLFPLPVSLQHSEAPSSAGSKFSSMCKTFSVVLSLEEQWRASTAHSKFNFYIWHQNCGLFVLRTYLDVLMKGCVWPHRTWVMRNSNKCTGLGRWETLWINHGFFFHESTWK